MGNGAMEIFGIFLSLALLMWGAYRGLSVILLAPLLAGLASMFQSGTPLTATYTEIFMKGMGGFVVSYFPIFLLGSLFGALMTDSGAAASVSRGLMRGLGKKHAIWAVIITGSILTYGGVSAWVVVFTMYPLGRALFRDANIPKRLLPGAIASGAFSSAMVSFPGGMQIHNTMPMPYFGTTPYAAPWLGIWTGVSVLVLSWYWLNREAQKAAKNGEGFGHEKEVNISAEDHRRKIPPFLISLLPIILVLALVYLYSEIWIPKWDLEYLKDAAYGGKDPKQIIGIWSVLFSLLTSVVFSGVIFWKYLSSPSKTLNDGTIGCLLPTLNTASEVGYGATIASLAAFASIKSGLLGFFAGHPLASAAFSINLLAAITGSASGGLSIALSSLGETYKNMAINSGISLETLHRIATFSCSGLDSLPHNGAVITLLTVCGLTHRQSYRDIFITTVVIPLAVLVFALIVI
jgi:H+/gluconate symporter-like permease